MWGPCLAAGRVPKQDQPGCHPPTGLSEGKSAAKTLEYIVKSPHE